MAVLAESLELSVSGRAKGLLPPNFAAGRLRLQQHRVTGEAVDIHAGIAAPDVG
jgi:hypothetical protein